MSASAPWLRALKFWQTRTALFVWQVQVYGTGRPYKSYLIADANQGSRGLRLSKEKPEDIHPQGPAAVQVRKHARSGTFRTILRDDASGDLWLPLHLPKAEAEDHPQYYVMLSQTRPPVLSFIRTADKASLVRISSQGSFTKKVTVEESLPHENLSAFSPVLPEIIALHSPGDGPAETMEEDLSQGMDEQRRKAVQQIRRRLKTLNKSLKKELQHAASEDQAATLDLHARLLQSYAYLAKPEAIELVLEPAYTGRDATLRIPLDPDLSVGKNIEEKFHQAKKARRALKLGHQQVTKVQRSIRDMEDAIKALSKDDGPDPEEILRQLGIRKKTTVRTKSGHQEQAKPYKTFISHETRIFVGKGAKENDELTKQAKGNDFWLHAVGVTGSHVIVEGSRFRNSDLPEALFRDAAILALHYSKLKADMAGEVYYTRRANIKKQKGMPAGLWNVEHSKSVFVRYEQDDLDGILKKAEL